MKYYGEYLKNIEKVNVSIEVADYPVSVEYKSPSEILLKNGMGYIQLPAGIKPFPNEIPVCSAKPIRIEAISDNTASPDDQDSFLMQTNFTTPQCVCGSELVPSRTKWKPLPSEHWAELMDLWHCHKPHTDSEKNETNPLYQLAMNGFHPTPTTAFYSDTYYLVERSCLSHHASDCRLISRINREEDSSNSTVKVWKWDLLPTGSKIGPLISSILKELVDAHATFTFEINKKLLIWVLNLSTNFTSSSNLSPQTDKLKLLYGDAEVLRSSRPDAEPVDIPSHVYDKLIDELDSINEGLPSGVQTLKNWKLGLL